MSGYDRLAPWYDLLTLGERGLVDAGLHALRAQPGERVMEVGCGPGRSLELLARAVGPTGRVVAVEASREMADLARRRTDRMPHVNVDCSHFQDAILEDGAFDAVFMSFVLELFPAPEMASVLARCHRCLRKGGRLVVVAMGIRGSPGVASRAYAWAHRQWPDVVDCRPIETAQVLADAGFTVTSTERLGAWGLPVDVVVAVVV